MSIDTKDFKKGEKVYHTIGGTGVLTGHFENDWSTDPPTVLAQVQVSNTVFYDVRMSRLEDLRHDRRGD